MNRLTRSFGFGLAAVVALGLGLRAIIAQQAWFKTDDFYFLNWVQSPAWRWSEVFLPTYARGSVLAYRPLGLDGYIFANFAAFGWNAFGYYVTAFGLQLATAAVVYRIARQEDYGRRIAWVVAAITLLAGPSLTATYAVAEHNYLCVGLFYALCVSLFLDQLRAPCRWRQVACSVLLLLGLWSNDVALTLAPLLCVLAFARAEAKDWKSRTRTMIARTWPELTILALYLDFRVSGLPSAQGGFALAQRSGSWFYEVDFGVDMLWNTLGNLAHSSGGSIRLVLLLLLTAAAIAVLWREGANRSWLGPAWLALAGLPFAVLAFPASRFALALLPAVALSIGAVVSALLPKLKDPRLQTAALIGVVVLCVPWEQAVSLATQPRWGLQQQAYALARATLPADDRPCLTILCGPGLANSADCRELRELTFGGELFRAVVPHRYLFVEFEDTRLKLAEFDGRDCTTYELRADRSLAVRERVRPAADDDELSQLH